MVDSTRRVSSYRPRDMIYFCAVASSLQPINACSGTGAVTLAARVAHTARSTDRERLCYSSDAIQCSRSPEASGLTPEAASQ